MALGAHTPVHSTLAAPIRPAPQLNQDIKRLNKQVATGQYARADRDAAKLLKRHPKHPGLLSLRGYVALVLGKPDQGLTWADRALAQAPADENAQVLAADCLLAAGHREAACQRLRAALAVNDTWGVRRKLAQILAEQQHHLAALDVLQAGLSGTPNAEMMEHIGRTLQNLHRHDEAANAFEIGMRLDPSHKPNFFLRAILAQKTKGADPRVYLLQVLQSDPADTYAIAQFLWASRGQCDWSAYDALAPADLAPLRHGDRPATPWYFLPLVDDPKACQQHQRQMQASHLARLGLKKPERAPLPPPSWDGRIRVGYFSSDFYDHATLRLFAGVLRHHDRRTFEIHCFDYGQNDHLTEQALRDVEHVHAVHGLSDSAVTTHARRIGLDIAVDLKGDTIGARSDLMLRGQAPVQINYLGYPGTMGSSAYDYIIADHVVLPPALESAFDEHVIRLLTCYLPSDDRVRPSLPPTRAEVGLPDTAMVLACLNDPYKITPAVFDIWMRALAAHPNTVLWLLDRSGDVRQNLVAAARARGVDGDRLIFAPQLAHPHHITRLAQADLYLDTFPCNAHTLASEAVCAANLPLLTLAGRQFAARVGASFITAAGLPDLVCTSEDAYETALLRLAADPAEVRRLRGQIATNRMSQPLFSSERYTRSLETAFATAHARARSGAKARSFDVPPDVDDPRPREHRP